MAKTKEELNALKEGVVTLNEKLHELTEEDLAQVAGGETVHGDNPVRESPIAESIVHEITIFSEPLTYEGVSAPH